MLMHGCKEGQCSSCKSFVLDGDDIELDRYSTFALPDYEQEEGYTLLCRAHAYEDLTIELLNYDEEMIRSGLPIQQAVAEVVANDPVTHDMRHLVLRLIEPDEIKFFPGQYVDIAIPGTDATRSFSMANTSSRESGQLEFVIKIYPDGLFSHFLDTKLAVGDRLDLTGPFGVFTLREGDERPGLRRRRRRDGADPVAAAVHGRARHRAARPPTTTARAAAGTCASRRSCARWRQRLPGFRYVPALSEPGAGRRLGRRDRPDHRRGAAARGRPGPARTPTSAGRRRWWRPRCRCSASSACPRSGSTTTSSRSPAIQTRRDP